MAACVSYSTGNIGTFGKLWMKLSVSYKTSRKLDYLSTLHISSLG